MEWSPTLIIIFDKGFQSLLNNDDKNDNNIGNDNTNNENDKTDYENNGNSDNNRFADQ